MVYEVWGGQYRGHNTYGRASSRKLTSQASSRIRTRRRFQGATPLQAIALLHAWILVTGASSGKVRNFFGKCQHAFRVGPAIRENIDPSSWIISTVRAPARTVDIKFDRVMDAALLMDQLQVEDEEGRPIMGTVRIIGGGCGVRLKPSRLLKRGKYRVRVGPLLEDVAGNRINEALDHSVNAKAP